VHGLLLLVEAASSLRYVEDHSEVKWFPAGFHIIEQGEPPTALFLLLAGHADVVREDAQGRRELVTRLQPGQFFGEQGIAWQMPRNAHVIAAESATCLVLLPRQPTRYEGRGEGARLVSIGPRPDCTVDDRGQAICLDVGQFLQVKLEALAAHRSQFPVPTSMLPESMLLDVFGVECFRPVQWVTDVRASGPSGELRPAHLCRGNGLVARPC
jgi:hypothetical protein